MTIDDTVIRAIAAHAEAEHPKECCGLVLRNGPIARVLRAENLAHDPYRSFKIDPVWYLRHEAHVEFVYHSHPNGLPNPTDADKAACEALNKPYLIMASPSGAMCSYFPQGFTAPLEGRQFVYGIFDCLSVVTDFYKQEFGLAIGQFERPPFGWWREGKQAPFEAHYKAAGFVEVTEPQHGDVLLMQVGDAKVTNHSGVYLKGGLLLHHSLNHVSHKTVYGGYWRKHTTKVLRHVDHT
jgi:proteasome lid subunit RPN8/RPN11